MGCNCEKKNKEFDQKTLKLTEQDPKEMLEYIKSLGVGIRPIDDPFFGEGDKICGVYTRLGIVDEDDEELCHQVMKTFKCDVLNCQSEFDNLLEYHVHYNSYHMFTCSECKKQFPSPHILDLHISETHDSFFQTLSERKPMFKCFVEDCQVVSSNPQERKSHCVDSHNFPNDYKYYTLRKSPKKKTKALDKIQTADVASEKKPSASDKCSRGPISFGHRRNANAFAVPQKQKREKQGKPIEMQELMDTLPSCT